VNLQSQNTGAVNIHVCATHDVPMGRCNSKRAATTLKHVRSMRDNYNAECEYMFKDAVLPAPAHGRKQFAEHVGR